MNAITSTIVDHMYLNHLVRISLMLLALIMIIDMEHREFEARSIYWLINHVSKLYKHKVQNYIVFLDLKKQIFKSIPFQIWNHLGTDKS